MVFQSHIPLFPLDRFIESIFYYEGLTPAHRMDRFLPDGNTEIVFDLGEGTQYIYDNETLTAIQACRLAWVSGIRTRPITIPSGRGSKMLIVAFKKGKAHPFYSQPMNEIADQVLDAELVFGRNVLDLREQLLEAPSINRMFLLVEDFLLRQAGSSLSPDTASECVDFALARIMNGPDGLGFQRLSDQIGYSQKHFINLFKKQVGVPPRQYMKIMRFQKAILQIEEADAIRWSELALQNGFYDQPHFINEFRYFSGFTPGEYMARKVGMLNYIPVH